MGDVLSLSQNLMAAAEAEHAFEPNIIGLIAYLVLVVGTIWVLFSIAKQDFGSRVFKHPLAQAAEQLYLFIENMCVGTIGAHGRKYVTMILTFWLMIFVGNVVALFFPFAPTADIGFNLGMALVAVGYVQWEGIQTNGLLGHLRHFAGPKLALALVPISVMIFVIEIISEVMKNVSLSLRLYGNIHGGHEAVEAMNKLGNGIYVPFGSFLMPIKLLTCLVQAMVFCLLICVYISLVTHHEEEGHGETAAAH